MNLQNGISIIICCYNSGWIISRCLDALKNQKVRDNLRWEIVVVNNASTDDTRKCALDAMKGCDIDFRVVDEATPGLLSARKRGIAEVKYKYTIYCDDDNLLCPEYIQGMYELLSTHEDIAAVGGMGVAEFMITPPELILKKYLSCYAIGTQKNHVDFLFGAGLATRTQLVRDIYDTQNLYLTGRCGKRLLAGDDSELVMSMIIRGWKIVSTDELTFVHVLHEKRLNMPYLKTMFEGFALSAPILSTYRSVIKGRKSVLTFAAYVKQYIVLLKEGIKYPLTWNIIPIIMAINTVKAYHHWGFRFLINLNRELTLIRYNR